VVAIAISVIGVLPQSTFAYDHRIALLIGLGKYESGKNKGFFRELPDAANDLETVGKALEKLGFDQIQIYSDLIPPSGSQFEYRSLLSPSDSPSMAVNSLHFQKLINDRLSALEDTRENSLLLIYFTGHGGIFGKAERVLAVPESEIGNPSSFPKVREILNTLAVKAASTDKLLVIDACADELRKDGEERVTKTDEELPVHIYSSKLGEMSFVDKNLGISVFTHYFVEALTRADEFGIGNVNGKIESDEIISFVGRYVPAHASMEQKKPKRPKNVPLIQHPWGSGGQNLVLTEDKTGPILPPLSANATEAERQSYLRFLNETYGNTK
jgi:Caspase domain